jgi:hypothetical protein
MRSEIRRIGNTICVDGIPVADFRLSKHGIERGIDWLYSREIQLHGDTIYVDGQPVADIRPSAKPFERDALADWVDPSPRSRRNFDVGTRHYGMVHQSYFASEGSCHATPAATNAP